MALYRVMVPFFLWPPALKFFDLMSPNDFYKENNQFRWVGKLSHLLHQKEIHKWIFICSMAKLPALWWESFKCDWNSYHSMALRVNRNLWLWQINWKCVTISHTNISIHSCSLMPTIVKLTNFSLQSVTVLAYGFCIQVFNYFSQLFHQSKYNNNINETIN